MTPALTDFPVCTAHRERACPDCYGVRATVEEIAATIEVHRAVEAGGFPQGPSTAGLAQWYGAHPPILFGLLTLLSILHNELAAAAVDPARVELAELGRITTLDKQVMALLTTFRERLEARGRRAAPVPGTREEKA